MHHNAFPCVLSGLVCMLQGVQRALLPAGGAATSGHVMLLKQKVLTAILRRLDGLLFGKLLAGELRQIINHVYYINRSKQLKIGRRECVLHGSMSWLLSGGDAVKASCYSILVWLGAFLQCFSMRRLPCMQSIFARVPKMLRATNVAREYGCFALPIATSSSLQGKILEAS